MHSAGRVKWIFDAERSVHFRFPKFLKFRKSGLPEIKKQMPNNLLSCCKSHSVHALKEQAFLLTFLLQRVIFLISKGRL
jgi:hypothetical protein